MDKCVKHQLARCGICAAAAAKGTVPQPAASMPAPPSITGGPPENIEGLSVRDRLPQTVEEANTDYDKILAEVTAIKANQPSAELGFSQPERTDREVPVGFQTLPTDDSHASKVMRAAAKYAEAARIYAVWVADTEKIKRTLIEVEAKLQAAIAARLEAEDELKKLITQGEA